MSTGCATWLLRARRLVELGLSLEEVADALASDDNGELREILTALDADLAAQEQRLQTRRRQIARLLPDNGELDLPATEEELCATLTALAKPDQPGLDREKMLLELLGPALESQAEAGRDIYRRVLDDVDLTHEMLDATARFEALAGLPPSDPRVAALAERAAGFGDAVVGLLPSELRNQPTDPAAAERLFAMVSAEMDPAQARCLQLMFAHWQEMSS